MIKVPHLQQVRLTISRYIPGVFAEAMRESSATSAVHMFDATHEHPELVWSDEARGRLAGHVAQLRDRYAHRLRHHHHAPE